jgi:HSP20 family protein
MPKVAVENVTGSGPESTSLLRKLETTTERIRQRAFEIFERHRLHGRALDDWLQAERDLLLAPESELIEKDGKYEIRIAAPGFKPAEINVTALPDALITTAESSHKHEEKDASVHFCDFGRKSLYRRLALPAPISVDKVTAHLDDGILWITAPKAGSAEVAGTAPSLSALAGKLGESKKPAVQNPPQVRARK